MRGEEMKRAPAYIAIDEGWSGELPAARRSSMRAPIAAVAVLGLLVVMVLLALGRAAGRSGSQAHPIEMPTHPATRSIKRPEPRKHAIASGGRRRWQRAHAAPRVVPVRAPRPISSPAPTPPPPPPPPSNVGLGEFF